MAETNTPDETAPQPRKRSRSKKVTTSPEKNEVAPVAPVVDTLQPTHQPVAPNKTKRIWSFINTNSAVLDMFVNTLTFLVVSCFGTWLVYKQNRLMENQNALIKQQMSLDEASRRGALITLMSNIMDKVDDEIKDQKNDLLKKGIPKAAVDTMKFSLSQSLIGQIAALSHSLKPYKFMDGDTLIESPLSPERGQLLITLILLPLDKSTFDKIYESSTFEAAALGSAILKGAYLRGVNLSRAYLTEAFLIGADLSKAVLIGANLEKADLGNADLSEAYCTYAYFREATFYQTTAIEGTFSFSDFDSAHIGFSNFTKAKLDGCHFEDAKFYDSILIEADMIGGIYSYTDFTGTDLSHAKLSGFGPYFTDAILQEVCLFEVNLMDVEITGADFTSADFTGASFSIDQISKVKTLYDCHGLPDSIKTMLLKIYPHLFEEPKQ